MQHDIELLTLVGALDALPVGLPESLDRVLACRLRRDVDDVRNTHRTVMALQKEEDQDGSEEERERRYDDAVSEGAFLVH
jgi:hypothetical protein